MPVAYTCLYTSFRFYNFILQETYLTPKFDVTKKGSGVLILKCVLISSCLCEYILEVGTQGFTF